MSQAGAVPLPRVYYQAPTLVIARDLVGKTLWRRDAAGLVGGVIAETEAYISAVDPASHNYTRPTRRAAVMYGAPGHAYIYQIFGVHYCLNVVTEPEGESAAVLIRALLPTVGIELMASRWPPGRPPRDLARGPGRVCRSLALTVRDNGADLTGDDLWISETPGGPPFGAGAVATSTRIGIARGVDLPWRFFARGSPAVSGPRRLNEHNG